MSPIRKIKRAYAELREAIQSTHTELLHQRTNCLHNLQNQGDAQVKLLEKTVEVLGEIRIGQAEMSGYLKSQNEHRHSD